MQFDIKPLDALHLALAESGNADYFCTCDDRFLRDWRNEDGDNSLHLLKLSAGQQVLRRLDNAYRQFFKGKRGMPRFHKPSHFNSVNFKPGDGASIGDVPLASRLQGY